MYIANPQHKIHSPKSDDVIKGCHFLFGSELPIYTLSQAI